MKSEGQVIVISPENTSLFGEITSLYDAMERTIFRDLKAGREENLVLGLSL